MVRLSHSLTADQIQPTAITLAARSPRSPHWPNTDLVWHPDVPPPLASPLLATDAPKPGMALPELVLLDRDGVINENRPDAVKSPSELRLIAGSAAAIARLNRAGIGVAIVTNQSVVGRGIISLAELDAIHKHLADALWCEAQARIDRIYFAPDAPDAASSRRKPRPGMLFEALADFQVDPLNSVMIGDNMTDFEAAYEAGCHFHLVRTGNGQGHEMKFRQELATLLPPEPGSAKPDNYIHDSLAAAIASIFDHAA